ncbi:MAG TPA: UvrD-helicase domain-containing protein [Candidatus Tectomicrobia bacterium]
MSAACPLFPHVVMRASAGTGKTFQLTNRYLSLINAGALPEQMLAVTFTRKAAGEILDRLLIRLAEAAASPDQLTELQRHITGATLDRHRCVELLKTLLHHLHRLRVSTLDSFFVQIAGVLALELGLPVGWQIVEELDDQRLRVEAIRVLLAEDALAGLVNLMRLLSKGEASRSVMAFLASVATDLYDLSQQTAASAWQALPRPQPLSQAALDAAIHQIAAFGFSDGRFTRARDADIVAASCEDWPTFVSKGLAGRIVAGEDTYYRKPIGSAVLDAYQPLIHHAQAVLLKQIADQNEATRRILDRFGQVYQRLKLRHRALRFEDITHVLAHTLTSASLDHVHYRLDTPIAHLLLDEFQDTSLTQWSAIQPFAERVTAQIGHSFFCVGDVKQAIYGWRGGVAELVDTVVGELPNVAEAQLNCSYRSSQTVIDTVNTVFGRLAANPVLSPYPAVVSAWSRRFATHTTVHSDLPGHCRLVTAPAANEDVEQALVTLQWAATEVARLHRAHPDRTIGILVRRNQAVARLIYALRHTHGIAASEEGGNPLTDSVAVQLILSLLRLADHSEDTVARFHVAYSPLGHFVGFEHYDDGSAAQRVSLAVRQRLMAIGYGRTIYGWVQALAHSCDQRELNRLYQLVELAYTYEPQVTERSTDFVAYVCAKKVEDPTAAPVRVMTMHQAKGLEFDIVVLPELDVNLEGLTPPVVVGRAGPTQPIEAVCRYVSKELRPLLPAQFQEMFAAHTTQVVNESLCLLYVAMTRAVHALSMIIAPSRPNEKTIAKTFAGIVRTGLYGVAKADPETILYDHGRPDWPPQPTGSTATDIPEMPASGSGEPEVLTIPLRTPLARRTRGLERVRPWQAVEGPGVRLADRMRPGASQAMARGALLHAWLEHIEWLDDGEPAEDMLRSVAHNFTSVGLDIEAEIRTFRSLLALPQTRTVLSRHAYGDLAQLGFSATCCADVQHQHVALRVLRERPFAVRENDAVVYGIIDRLVLFCLGDRVLAADLLDFKSDALAVRDTAEIDEAVARYQPQLTLYHRAITQQFRLDVDCIVTRLLFVQVGEIRRVAVL